MSADIIYFVPKTNPKADRAFWIGPPKVPAEVEAILADTAYPEGANVDRTDLPWPRYVAPDNDCA